MGGIRRAGAVVASLALAAWAGPATAQPAFTVENPLQVIDQDLLIERIDPDSLLINDLPLSAGGELVVPPTLKTEFEKFSVGTGNFEFDTTTGIGTLDGIAVRNPLSDILLQAETYTAVQPSEDGVRQFRQLVVETAPEQPLFSKFYSVEQLQTNGVFVTDEQRAMWSSAAIDPAFLPEYQANVAAFTADVIRLPESLRIIHGEPVVRPDQYADAVMVLGLLPDGRTDVCSGVAVAPQVVITAAHCVCVMDVKQVLFGLATIDAEADLVRVASSRSFLPCEVFSSSEAVGARIGEGDLAVIQLERPTTANVAFRQLAPEDAIALVPNIRAVGFGQSDENGVLALRGKYAADIVIASRDCANIEQMFPFMTQYRCQSMHEMVAAGETDTCKGDSGGPAYVLKGDQFFLAAITSRSVDPGGACGAGGIYVKVAQERFRAFLTNNGVPSSAWTQ